MIGKKGIFGFTASSRNAKSDDHSLLGRPIDNKDMKYSRSQALHKAEKLFGECRLGQLCQDYDAAMKVATTNIEKKETMSSEIKAVVDQVGDESQVQQLLQ